MQPPHQPPPYQQPPQFQPPPYQPPPAPPVPASPATPLPVQREVNVMEGFRFSISGPHAWNNILFMALCYASTQVIPIVGVIVMMGFFAEIHRRLVLRHPEPYLRFDLSDLGNYLSRGVAPFLLIFVLVMPFIVIVVLEAMAMFGGIGVLSQHSGADATLVVLGMLGVMSLVSAPVYIFWAALSNSAMTRAELTGDLSKAFNLGAVWSYAGKTWKRAFVTALVMGLVSFALSVLGLLACFIGILVTLPITMIAGAHVRWQIYNEYLLEGGEPIELAPWETLPSEIKPQYGAPPPQPPPPAYQPPPYGAPPPRY